MKSENRNISRWFHGLLLIKWSYLADIIKEIKTFTMQFHAAYTHMWDISDNAGAFRKKIELWRINLKQKILEMFTKVDDWNKLYKVGEQVVFVTNENHFAMPKKNVEKFFLALKNLSYEWVRNLSQITPGGLSTAEEEIFKDFTLVPKSESLIVNHFLNFGKGWIMSVLQ